MKKIKYYCPLCLKEFGNKKDNYQKHLNKTGCGAGITKLEEIIRFMLLVAYPKPSL
jgi:hypothetical protein